MQKKYRTLCVKMTVISGTLTHGEKTLHMTLLVHLLQILTEVRKDCVTKEVSEVLETTLELPLIQGFVSCR